MVNELVAHASSKGRIDPSDLTALANSLERDNRPVAELLRQAAWWLTWRRTPHTETHARDLIGRAVNLMREREEKRAFDARLAASPRRARAN
jgi:hypothetical protein